MNFTAKDVAALREKTGCGMMDCKKALTATEGDVDAAIEFLREKGLAAAAKKATRIAAEGVAFAKVGKDGKDGVVIEVNAETDFVAKNDKFKEFVEICADTVLECKPADVDALLVCKAVGAEGTIEELLREKIQTIGENIKIRRFTCFEGNVVTYIHAAGKIGVMVKFDVDGVSEEDVIACGKDVCMQIAAMNPSYMDKSVVPAEVIAQEKEVLLAQIQNDPKNAKKPANILDKMVEGKIGKYYETNCLLQQEFVKNGDFKVEGYIADVAKKAGGSLKLVDFVRLEKGEGLEKRNDNFADEVAGMIK